MSNENKPDDACCGNCFYATDTDIDGLVDCNIDGRSKDADTAPCDHWDRQD